jgi:hypothetical protein
MSSWYAAPVVRVQKMRSSACGSEPFQGQDAIWMMFSWQCDPCKIIQEIHYGPSISASLSYVTLNAEGISPFLELISFSFLSKKC